MTILFVDPKFEVGEEVVLTHLEQLPSEARHWTSMDSLSLDTPYTVNSTYFMSEIGDILPMYWVKFAGHIYWHSPLKFRRLNEIMFTKGKSMPQVISTNIELDADSKLLLTQFATSTGLDIIIYDDKGAIVPSSSPEVGGYHIRNFAARGDAKVGTFNYPINSSGAPNSFIRLPGFETTCKYATPFTRLGYCYHAEHNQAWFMADLLTPLSDHPSNIMRLKLLHLCLTKIAGHKYCKVFPESMAKAILLDQMNSAVLQFKARHTENIDTAKRMIADCEAQLTAQWRTIYELSHIKYELKTCEDVERICTEIEKFRPQLKELNIFDSFENNPAIRLVLKPFVFHLPGGDIPVFEHTIWISTGTTFYIMMKNILFPLPYCHPHYNGEICWGGFKPLAIKCISMLEIPMLIGLLLQWVTTYDPTNAYKRLSMILKDVSIYIEESVFLIPTETVSPSSSDDDWAVIDDDYDPEEEPPMEAAT